MNNDKLTKKAITPEVFVFLGIFAGIFGGLAEDKNFRKYFKKYQFPALTNLGTSFGMGMIVSAAMIGLEPKGGHTGIAVLVGNIGAIVGSIISVRIMLHFTKKEYGTEEMCIPLEDGEDMNQLMNTRKIRSGGLFGRALEALLDDGKGGVDVGLSIIPGVLAICTLVMMLTNGPSADSVQELWRIGCSRLLLYLYKSDRSVIV